MESQQFEQLVRRLNQARSRRGLLAGVIASSVGVAGSEILDAKKRRKKKKGKKKGKNKNSRTTTTQPAPTTAPPFCAGKPDLTHCGGHPITGNFCSGGVCAQHPSCIGYNEGVCQPGPDPDCCSGLCKSCCGICECSAPGEPCVVTSDCCASEVGMQQCVGFICQRL